MVDTVKAREEAYLKHQLFLKAVEDGDSASIARQQKCQAFLKIVENNDLAASRALLKEESLQFLSEWVATEQTPLHVAAEQGWDEMVRLLLDAGANVNASRGQYSNIPLTEAKKASTIRILIDAGANFPSAFSDFYDVKPFSADVLMEAGVSPNDRDAYNQTLLHTAASKGDTKGIQALLAAGAEVNARDQSENTPLHYSSDCEREAIQALVQAGGEIEARNDDGDTPLLASLRRLGYDYGVLSFYSKRMFEYSARMLEAGADFNARASDGNTPLHLICLSTSGIEPVAAQHLIQLTTDINAVNNEGETPLSLARRRDNPHLVSMLREAVTEHL